MCKLTISWHVCINGMVRSKVSHACISQAEHAHTADATYYSLCRDCILQVKKDFQEAVLSYRQDEFFHKNMYANFGDIGSAVKELVDEFQKQTTNTKRINTIEDMQVRNCISLQFLCLCTTLLVYIPVCASVLASVLMSECANESVNGQTDDWTMSEGMNE